MLICITSLLILWDMCPAFKLEVTARTTRAPPANTQKVVSDLCSTLATRASSVVMEETERERERELERQREGEKW